MLVILYGCETWSLTLTEERSLNMFEKMVMSRIFGAKMDEVTESGENYIMRILDFRLHYSYLPPMKIEQSVPKRRYIKFRRQRITQKKDTT